MRDTATTEQSATPAPQAHLLTVALEDYFQVGAFNRLIRSGQWSRFEPRLETNTRRTLDLLDRHQIKATFFILGWVADKFPELVRLVVERGHEIASKGYYHRSIREMSKEEFREELQRSRAAIERAAGKRVLGYRVAHEWFQPADLWALDVLAEEGFAYDSSISPTRRTWAAEPWRRFVHQHRFQDKVLWEFPLSSWRFLGWTFSIAGGNYFRQFPHWFMQWAVRRWQRYGAPFVLYFHIWELDPDQPKIHAASLLTRIRHYRNLDKMADRLEHYFRTYRFTSIADYLGLDTTLSPEEVEARQRPAPPPEVLRPSTAERVQASVVIPCFNEEETLKYLANTLNDVRTYLAEQYDFQFVLVDDRSTDATWDVLQALFGTQPNFKLVRHERNLGVAGAILTGIRHADHEIVCSMDCDCSYDPHELGRMIPLLTDGVDMVTASPYHPQGQVRNVQAWRLTISKAASFLYRRILRQKLHTYTSCFRVYRRSALLNLEVRETGYLGVAETLARLDLQGSRIVEYPATLDVRVFGWSKIKVLRTTLGHLGLMLRLLRDRLFGPAPRARPAPPSDTLDPLEPQRRSV